jgi:hypothetical protein
VEKIVKYLLELVAVDVLEVDTVGVGQTLIMLVAFCSLTILQDIHDLVYYMVFFLFCKTYRVFFLWYLKVR